MAVISFINSGFFGHVPKDKNGSDDHEKPSPNCKVLGHLLLAPPQLAASSSKSIKEVFNKLWETANRRSLNSRLRLN